MSTISPTLTRRLGEAAASAGVGFLDAPMSGTSAMVERGDCTIFAGGDASRIEACRPVFAAIAKRTVHVGPIGSASLAKLATNLLVALNTAAVAEALVLGVKGGLDPQALLDILKDSAAASKMVDVRGPLMVEHRFDPQMKLDLFLKDFRLMLEEAQRLGVALPLTSLTQQICTATVAAGRGGARIWPPSSHPGADGRARARVASPPRLRGRGYRRGRGRPRRPTRGPRWPAAAAGRWRAVPPDRRCRPTPPPGGSGRTAGPRRT